MIIDPEEDLTFLSDGRYTDDGSPLHEAVFRVVIALPESVQDFVKDNVVFYAQPGVNAVATRLKCDCRCAGIKYAPKQFRRKRPAFDVRFIMLHECLEKEPRAVQDYVVAHEVAHLWCNHEMFAHDTSLEQFQHERCEDEADRQANEWGFRDPRPRP